MGFEILKTRPINDFVEIEKFENEIGLKLPPLYKLFVNCFFLGEKGIIVDKYIDPKSGREYRCQSYNFYFNDRNVGLQYFMEIKDSFGVYLSGGLPDKDYAYGYLPIAASDGNGLSVGMKGLNTDKIIWDRADATDPVVIAENIFEFVRGIQVETVEDEFLTGNIKLSQLSKNYSDSVWKARNI